MGSVFRAFPAPPPCACDLDFCRLETNSKMRRFLLKPDPWSETPWSSQNHAAEEFLVRSRSLGCSCEISIRQASLSHQSEDRVDCRGDELVLAGLQRHTIAVRSTSTATLGIHGPVNPSMKLNLLLGRFSGRSASCALVGLSITNHAFCGRPASIS